MQINKNTMMIWQKWLEKWAKESGKSFWANLGESIIKSGQSNTKMVAAATVAAAFAGGLSKWGILKLNRAGSKRSR